MEKKELQFEFAPDKVACFLERCLEKTVAPEALEWISNKCSQLSKSNSPVTLYTAFSAAPRMVGKVQLELDKGGLEEAAAIRRRWKPEGWTADQAARCLLLLACDARNADQYVAMVDKLFSTADMRELVALYQALPLLPYPERYRRHAEEAVRSNMVSVFHAIALGNPYPFERFDEPAWNQMVLKVAFIGSPMNEIVGLEARANANLAIMLRDLIQERRAAGRGFPEQVWPLIAPFADERMAEGLHLTSEEKEAAQRNAAISAQNKPGAEAR